MEFCAWCLTAPPTGSISVHVMRCSLSLMKGRLIGTQELFNKCHSDKRAGEITRYISSDKVLLDDRAPLITELRIDLDARLV